MSQPVKMCTWCDHERHAPGKCSRKVIAAPIKGRTLTRRWGATHVAPCPCVGGAR